MVWAIKPAHATGKSSDGPVIRCLKLFVLSTCDGVFLASDGVFVIYSSLTVLELAMKFIVIGSTKKSVSGEMARYFPKALPHT